MRKWGKRRRKMSGRIRSRRKKTEGRIGLRGRRVVDEEDDDE